MDPVKSSSAISLDQAIVPIKSALVKNYGHDPIQEREDYLRRHHHHQHHQRDLDHASSAPADSKHHSRIDIANLLCSSEGADREEKYTADASRHHAQPTSRPRHDRESHSQHDHSSVHLRAITEEADDHNDLSHPSSPYNGNGNISNGSSARDSYYSSHNDPSYGAPSSASINPSTRESAFPSRAMDTSNGSSAHADRYPYSNLGTRPASFSAASSSSSAQLYPASGSTSYTTTPRSTPPGSQQRSASWNNDRYKDYSHSYEQEQHRRTDRSKSDYALHQQNYGPYLNPSPPMTSAVLPKPHMSGPSASSSTSSSSSVATAPPPGNDSPASLYYHSSAQPVRSSAPSSSASSSPYAYAPSGPTEQHKRPGHGPILPPPAALLSGVENKPPRVYGRDSTVDDYWPPAPRTNRIVPVDAPNETRPFTFNNSSMLPPPYPSSSSSQLQSSSSSSSSYPSSSYPSSYSSNSMEQKPRRVYGIDAADIPQRQPPHAPSSSYGSSQYPKSLQDIPDVSERENVRKPMQGHDGYQRQYNSSMSAAYGSQAYGYSAPPPPPSHQYPPAESDRSRYDYEHRGWKANQRAPAMESPPPSASNPNYPPPQPYSRPQSPTMDLKPPPWYQDYAHSVPPKTQSQSSYQHPDSHYYSNHGHHYAPGDYIPTDDVHGEKHRSSSSKRSSKSGMTTSQSVHPFDTPEPKSSKSKKPKRIKNPGHDEDLIVMDDESYAVKAKRKRANASQLSVLNAAFERSYFPSTEERLRLSKQCRMCPRTVQIWFQNKRQSVKARSEAMDTAAGEGRRDSDENGRHGSGSNEGQKRSVDEHGQSGQGGKRTGSGSMMPSEAVMSALHIQLDGRSVDYFSRKRRATIAKMEQNEQQKQQQKSEKQQGSPSPEQYSKEQQEES
ncbi:hypothetical protein BGZ50_005188 [Haplosporangium sp. Z 11]|nr:hypothetical protein BGZ50_005188 [Haplosporangium sp. Z 11]